MLGIHCPKCGSKEIRASLAQSVWEEVGKVAGYLPLRCRACDERFRRQIWDFGNSFYAKCPRCYRLDLTTWSLHYYHAPMHWVVLMKLGWRRHRCNYCRHNFIGLRPAKFKAIRKEAYPE